MRVSVPADPSYAAGDSTRTISASLRIRTQPTTPSRTAVALAGVKMVAYQRISSAKAEHAPFPTRRNRSARAGYV